MHSKPVWHSPHVSRQQRAALKQQRPVLVWFTGLSGAGKSTLANAVEALLVQQQRHTFLLDGDNVRLGLNSDLSYSAEGRTENLRRIGEVGKLLVDAGLITLAAFVSPAARDRQQLRALFAPGEFIEVFVDAPLQVCEQRDPKGLYRQARNGLISNFTGVNAPYEAPLAAELRLDTCVLSIEQAAQQVLDYLRDHHYLTATV